MTDKSLRDKLVIKSWTSCRQNDIPHGVWLAYSVWNAVHAHNLLRYGSGALR